MDAVSAVVETKVTASTAAAVSTGFVLWVLNLYVFDGDVPGPVAAFVAIVVLGLVTFGAGFVARHTHRPDLAAPVVPAEDEGPSAGTGRHRA